MNDPIELLRNCLVILHQAGAAYRLDEVRQQVGKAIALIEAERIAVDTLKRHTAKVDDESTELEDALSESVKLQSHYASLLNQYDGGERMQFATADAWVERLALLKKRHEADALKRITE